MSATFVCPQCDKVRGKSQLVEVRRESRDSNQGRRHVVLLKKICRICDDAEVAELRPTKVPNVPEPSDLFSQASERKGA